MHQRLLSVYFNLLRLNEPWEFVIPGVNCVLLLTTSHGALEFTLYLMQNCINWLWFVIKQATVLIILFSFTSRTRISKLFTYRNMCGNFYAIYDLCHNCGVVPKKEQKYIKYLYLTNLHCIKS